LSIFSQRLLGTEIANESWFAKKEPGPVKLKNRPISHCRPSWERQVMKQEEPGHGDLIRPLDWMKAIPFQAAAVSDRLGWVGLQAVRYYAAPASEFHPPAMTHHRLILFTRPPEELDLRYEGVRRYLSPPAGSISLIPAGSPAQYRWSGDMDTLNVYLEPGMVGRVAAEAFGLDPTRTTVPPLDGPDLPHLRATMCALDAELTTGSPGGPLAAESLANVLAVQLIRHISAPRKPERSREGKLPRARLHAVMDYIEEHLDASPSLEQMASIAHISPYHFARQFKTSTGLPPHQYVIARRVERAKHLLQEGGDFSLAEVAVHAGFSDQSQFSQHFKRIVGVTPGRFRTPARIT
jgi:AraC family transcriptional regulator